LINVDFEYCYSYYKSPDILYNVKSRRGTVRVVVEVE
jgi:hypothetical protein